MREGKCDAFTTNSVVGCTGSEVRHAFAWHLLLATPPLFHLPRATVASPSGRPAGANGRTPHPSRSAGGSPLSADKGSREPSDADGSATPSG